RDLLKDLGLRQWDFRRLKSDVIYSAVVGSHAWGLANEDSDEDIRGCFVAPFEDLSSLWDMPDEVHDPVGDASYWEVEKLIEQGLRGDANTLETLWSPLHREVTGLGRELLSRREMFVSMNILGSFGRYAQSQFKKIERSLLRDEAVCAFLTDIRKGVIEDVEGAANILQRFGIAGKLAQAKQEVHAVCRSLFDRGLTEGAAFENVVRAVRDGREAELVPSTYRPKNAYNLLRLLHSCITWLKTGQPLIEVTGDLRARLLEIKDQNVPIEEVVAEAKEVAAAVDDAAEDAKLPESPRFDVADEFLKMCRRQSARRSVGVATASAEPVTSIPSEAWVQETTPVPLPPDIHVQNLREFFADQIGQMRDGRVIWVALTGSHTYGFPSPDSDLDLKGVHVLSAARLLGLREPKLNRDYLDNWRGREYDLTLNELGTAAKLILTGNGNMLERLLGPMPLLTTP
ncbi:MAG: nucleotidyltransferase domain-containing protein, partial [Myxococcota bacterium]